MKIKVFFTFSWLLSLEIKARLQEIGFIYLTIYARKHYVYESSVQYRSGYVAAINIYVTTSL